MRHLLKDGHPILSHSYFTFRWGYPMICTISSTICGLKTSLLESFLDKHMPWISGQPNQHHPVITRRIMQMQPMAPIPTATKTMSFNVSPDIDEKKHKQSTPAKRARERDDDAGGFQRILRFYPVVQPF